MLVAVIGGNLQGIEATYLAQKAGWEVLLIDKNPRAGASLMCDRVLHMTITDSIDPCEFLHQVELIIPAIENNHVLAILKKLSLKTGIPMAFDWEAYAISSSKQRSNQVFKECHISMPEIWPECGFPMVVKPDGGSGSQGVKIIHNEKELISNGLTKETLDRIVDQAY